MEFATVETHLWLAVWMICFSLFACLFAIATEKVMVFWVAAITSGAGFIYLLSTMWFIL